MTVKVMSARDAKDTLLADFFIESDAGYDEWLSGKVSRTLERVASGESTLTDHTDAMAQLKKRIAARLRQAR